MILKANQRGGARQLSRHLLRADDNDHVEIHEIKGFVADDLAGALHEAYAVSCATRCEKFLFSVSLNPPKNADVPVEAFESAVAEIEARLGLKEQPRAIVFHEKNGRRHAHAVWSRINAEKMKAIKLPYYKERLTGLSRDLFVEHGWDLPAGLIDRGSRDPANYSRAQYQQAKRTGISPKDLKIRIKEAWAISDSPTSFAHALEERGLFLARGDQRGHVAVEPLSREVFSIARWADRKAKEVRAKLGEPDALPSVSEAKIRIAERMTSALQRHVHEAETEFAQRLAPVEAEKRKMVERHRAERRELEDAQTARATTEAHERASRLRTGLRGLWDRLIGKHKKIILQNQREVEEATRRDREEKHGLSNRQLAARDVLEQRLATDRAAHESIIAGIQGDIAVYARWRESNQEPAATPQPLEAPRQRGRRRDHEPER